MKISVVGATGGVGTLLTERALAAGHDVTAIARKPEGFPPQVRTATVDFAHPDLGALEIAIAGADAVLSCLGPSTRKDSAIVLTSTRILLDTAATAGVGQFSMISASPVGTTASKGRPDPPAADPGDDFLTARVMTPIIRLFFGSTYAALAESEDLVTASGLDWTIVRPPRLTDGPFSDHYRTSTDTNIRGGRAVSRANVADLLLRSADEPDLRNRIVRISD